MKPIGKDHEIIKLIRQHKKQNVRDGYLIVDELGVMDMYLKRPNDMPFSLSALIVCEALLTEEFGLKLMTALISQASDVFSVSKKTFDILAEKKNAGGLIAVIQYKKLNIQDYLSADFSRILVMDGLENPGNAGTILRTADAAGIDCVLAVDMKTYILSAKCISASRGTIFHVPVFELEAKTAIQALLDDKYLIYLAEPKDGKPYHQVEYAKKSAMVVGSERFGIQNCWFEAPHSNIYIPMMGEMSSLNVGVAASILMYALNQAN